MFLNQIDKIKVLVGMKIKNHLPKSLLGRSLLIIVIPLILLQLVSGTIFYETHWDKVTLRLARGVAGDIASIVSLLNRYPEKTDRIELLKIASEDLGLYIQYKEDSILKSLESRGSSLLVRMLSRAMNERMSPPFRIDTEVMKRSVVIDVQLPKAVLHIVTSRKRLFSSTVYVFILWMIGSSLILFGAATIFMRNQVKPIQRLAFAAENFGKGRDDFIFKAEGANEVRQAALAFLSMKERILAQIRQRTDMLAGVSHDLRTPLTRMRLELEMLTDDEATQNLKLDVSEMERMLDGYLAFARGEGHEKPVLTSLVFLLDSVVTQANKEGGSIEFYSDVEIILPLQLGAFKRCIVNIINNSRQYADNTWVRIKQRGEIVDIIFDDDGPGIPQNKWLEVFKPFYRIDKSRNLETGGVGLGLTIVNAIVRGHGGDVTLDKSKSGGLSVKISLPI